jgi:hypothetical protein
MDTFKFIYDIILRDFFKTSHYPSKKKVIQLKPTPEHYDKIVPNLIKIYDIDNLKIFANINNLFRLLLIIKNNKHIIIRVNKGSKRIVIGFICDDLVFTFYHLDVEKVLEYLFYILDSEF